MNTMKVELEAMPLNIVLSLAKAELMSTYNTSNVDVLGVSIDYDYSEDDDSGAPLIVIADIDVDEKGNAFPDDETEHKFVMVWDNELVGFHTIMRLDQQIKEKNE